MVEIFCDGLTHYMSTDQGLEPELVDTSVILIALDPNLYFGYTIDIHLLKAS